jgi:hypothetical protein
LAEESGVEVDRRLVFGGHVDILEDRVHGTYDLALLAVDADFRIDIKLRRTGFGVNARHRTNFYASAVVGT